MLRQCKRERAVGGHAADRGGANPAVSQAPAGSLEVEAGDGEYVARNGVGA